MSAAWATPGLAALARGAWPALEWLDLRDNRLVAEPTLEDARRRAPALKELHKNESLGFRFTARPNPAAWAAAQGRRQALPCRGARPRRNAPYTCAAESGRDAAASRRRGARAAAPARRAGPPLSPRLSAATQLVTRGARPWSRAP